MKNLSLIIIGMVLFTGCSSQNFETVNTDDKFLASAVYSFDVDVLWVIDTSSETMAVHQNRIAAKMGEFYDGLVANNANFRVAATTMNLGGGGGCETGSDNGELLGTVPVVTKSTPSAVVRLQDLLKRGGDGCNAEMGLEAMKIALERERVKGAASKFLRKDALLVIVFVMDDDDFSPGSLNSYKNYLDNLKGENAEGEQKWIANSIGVTDLNDPLCTTYGSYSAKSVEVEALANISGGVVESVCSTDFSSYVNQINVRLKSVINRYKLESTPILDSLRVYINGVLIREDDVNGWRYDAENRTIVLNGTAAPGPNDDVDIKYEIREL